MKRPQVIEQSVVRGFRTIRATAPLQKNGYVEYVEISNHVWFCRECHKRVPPSAFEAHAKHREW